MSVSPTLETGRLKLRQIREEDVHDIFAYARNPAVLRYTTGQTPADVNASIPFVTGLAHTPDDSYAWGMCLKDTDRLIGIIEFTADGAVGSVDYAMAEPYWNRGLMTEAVRNVLEWGFGACPRIMEIRASAHVDNTASRRVMEKCGMKHERTVEERWKKLDAPVTLTVYSILRGQNVEAKAPVWTDKISHAPSGYLCPFCALLAGRTCDGLHTTPDDIVCRDDRAIAFIAAHWWEKNPGHVLVIPIAHFENLYDLPDDFGAAIFAMSRRVAVAMRHSYGCEGISTRQHNEPAGYQGVWHYHLHIFPRYRGDGLYPADWQNRLTTPVERRPYAIRLRSALANHNAAMI